MAKHYCESNEHEGQQIPAEWVAYLNPAIARDEGYTESQPLYYCEGCMADVMVEINPALPNEWIFDSLIRLSRKVPEETEENMERDSKDRIWVVAKGEYAPPGDLEEMLENAYMEGQASMRAIMQDEAEERRDCQDGGK
jgi:hypothetical protein